MLGRSSSDRSLQRFMFHFPNGWFMTSSLLTPRGLSCAPARGGGSRGVTHGELSNPFPSREEHRRGRGYPPARQGCSRGRKKGIFRRPDRAGLGPDVAPLSPPASPEQFGNILGGDNQTLAGAERRGLLPVPRRKPRARGAGFSVLPSLAGRREVGLHPPAQGHGGVPQDPHE